MASLPTVNCQFNLFSIYYDTSNSFELLKRIEGITYAFVIVTPNIDHIVRAYRNKEYRIYCQEADICINDSKVLAKLVLVFLRRRLNTVTGSDLTHLLLRSKKLEQKTIAIVGCETYQINKLKEIIAHTTIVKHFNPPMGFYKSNNEIAKACTFILNSNADFIFLAVGSPQQEMLAHMVKPRLKKGVILCIGASIDYLTGKEKRAPNWMQEANMEWLYRFLQSPFKRFKRYFINCPQIFYILWKERAKFKKLKHN